MRSDGSRGTTYTLTFDQAGTKEVSTAWQLSGGKHAGWQAIKILVPNEFLSEKASFKIDSSK